MRASSTKRILTPLKPLGRMPVWVAGRRRQVALLPLLLFAMISVAQKPSDPEQWLEEAEAAYTKITNYSAVLYKQQRVNGKLMPKETIFLKFQKPFSLYMRWIAAPFKDYEVLYVEGLNDNRAKIHARTFIWFGTWNLHPQNPRLMSNNLRPLTATGLGYLLTTVATNVRKAQKFGELRFYYHGEEMVYGRQTQRLEVIFPNDKNKGYEAYRLFINQDCANKLFVRINIYDWNNYLIEHYGYENIKFDNTFTANDFDAANPEYRF